MDNTKPIQLPRERVRTNATLPSAKPTAANHLYLDLTGVNNTLTAGASNRER